MPERGRLRRRATRKAAKYSNDCAAPGRRAPLVMTAGTGGPSGSRTADEPESGLPVYAGGMAEDASGGGNDECSKQRAGGGSGARTPCYSFCPGGAGDAVLAGGNRG